MDIPVQKTIKIGNAKVGLVGIEIALSQVLQKKMSDEQAAAFLFDAIRKHNYIPNSAKHTYKQALLQEYKRHRYKIVDEPHVLTIRILGRPCVSCNRLKDMVIEILGKHDMAADVEDIQDLDEIWRYGVTKTPALIINGLVKSVGLLPTITQVEQWIRETVER